MDSTPRLGVSPAGPTGAEAASVELHSPARETHTGMCLLNEISDNVVGHLGNKPNKAPALGGIGKRPLGCRPHGGGVSQVWYGAMSSRYEPIGWSKEWSTVSM